MELHLAWLMLCIIVKDVVGQWNSMVDTKLISIHVDK